MSTILDILTERELTPEQREARRQRARARRERARTARPADSIPEDSTEVSDELRIGDTDWLEGQWKKCNAKYFGGQLVKPNSFDFERAKSRYGRCCCDYDASTGKIYCYLIGVSREFKNYASFRNTLVHEMVHQWCYQRYTDDDIRRANGYGQARSRNWWRALTSDTGKDSHHGTWLSKTEDLMAKFPELSIDKYTTQVEDGVSDAEKEKRALAAYSAHVLIRKPYYKRIRYFYYVSDDAYEELKKKIESGYSDSAWYEYDFNREKMPEYIKEPMKRIGTECYKIGYFQNLVENRVIFIWSKRML